MERGWTPEPAMVLGIQSYITGLSLSNAVELLDYLGVQQSRKAIHDCLRRLKPLSRNFPARTSAKARW